MKGVPINFYAKVSLLLLAYNPFQEQSGLGLEGVEFEN